MFTFNQLLLSLSIECVSLLHDLSSSFIIYLLLSENGPL